MEGSYSGSIEWFAQTRSQVSAHFCVKEDGSESTQMVHLSDRAWHACAANSRSVGIEMAGYTKNGFKPELLKGTAAITAWLCHYLQIPVRHARGGVGPGIESHWGLGRSGGGHCDPSTDPAWVDRFVQLTQTEFAAGYDPHWIDATEGARPCALAILPLEDGTTKPPPPKLDTTSSVQRALTGLGFKVDVDGDLGPKTEAAIRAFQAYAGITADGVFGPGTRAALLTETSKHS